MDEDIKSAGPAMQPVPSARLELGSRLALVLDLHLTRKAAATVAGVTTEQLATYVHGRAKVPFEVVRRLTQPKDISLDWLATGEGPMRMEQRAAGTAQPSLDLPGSVPVVGLAECGLRGWYQDGFMAVRASRPGDLADPDAFAVIAVGKSMIPAGIRPGYLCFCTPHGSPSQGDAVYIERQDGKATIKEFLRGDPEWLFLQGWLDPEGDEAQIPYTDQLRRNQIRRFATVVYIKRKL